MPICKIFNYRGENVREFDSDTLGGGGAITIGRSSQCTVCLKGEVDRHVGRIHVSLQREGRSWTATNCSSTELYKNEQPITTAVIEEGDMLRFGHMFLTVGERSGPSPYELAFVGEEGKQERRVLWPGRNTIGSSSENTICIKEMGLARSHARILVNPHDMLVEDVASSSGTFLDEQRVKSLTKFAVGATLRLGKADIQVLLRGTPLDRFKRPAESSPGSPMTKWVVGAISLILFLLLSRWLGWW
ncbi:MAG: FHA domain-containing protein [Lentisphaeria bacterium]|nr:FHA domain-containing protein [Lentisphaeria bacterium]